MDEQLIFCSEWQIGSQFGQEKTIMSEIAGFFASCSMAVKRLDDMLTAVSEACLNALEHGNRLHADRRVRVRMKVFSAKTVIRVFDEGPGFDYAKWTESQGQQVRVEHKLEADDPRGWGLYLIHELADRIRCGKESGSFYVEMEFANETTGEKAGDG